jgi:hypothetical protein
MKTSSPALPNISHILEHHQPFASGQSIKPMRGHQINGGQMMKKIWKYQIPDKTEFALSMPKDSKVLCLKVQHGIACVWVLVDTKKEPTQTRFEVFGTGWEIKKDVDYLDYIDTWQIANGELIFHLFKDNKPV